MSRGSGGCGGRGACVWGGAEADGEGRFLGKGGWFYYELDPAARRATVDGHVRGCNGPDAAKIRHAMKVVDFGARF